MKKIGILTFHFVENIGGVLQAYALEKKVNEMNSNVEFIDFIPYSMKEPYTSNINLKWILNKFSFSKALKTIMYRIINKRKLDYRESKFEEFRNNHMNRSKQRFKNRTELIEANLDYDVYIVGSDQVWNPQFLEIAENVYSLDFIQGDVKKISYAASMGVNPDEKYNNRFREFIKDFNFISVRENNMINYLKGFTNNKIDIVLDPTLLLNKEEWLTIAENTEIDEKYILIYDLELNDVIVNLANAISSKLNLKIISYSDNEMYMNRFNTFKFEGPKQFINLVHNAEFIISSSFHGTVFAILFNKPFYTVPHSTRGSRMINLLNNLKLSDRLWNSEKTLDEIAFDIDFTEANKLLIELRNESLEFINKLPIK